MKQAFITQALLAFAMTASAGLACAQTTVAPNPAPATVGVSPGTAINAETKAVPRSDTATLVRTDKSRRMASPASAVDGSTASATGDAIDNAEPPAAGRRVKHARN